MILERNKKKHFMNNHYQVIVVHYPIISSWPSNRWIQESRESSTMDEIGKVEENEIKKMIETSRIKKDRTLKCIDSNKVEKVG